MYLLYSLLYALALVLGTPYLLYRSLREEGFGASLRERLVGIPANPRDAGSIWIHAVSVGEVIAASSLVPRLRRAFPGTRLALSVTTPTGRRVAQERLSGIDELFYCPFDLALLVRRAARRVKPRALLVIETEIWPHLVREARRWGAATLLVNGRISDRSFPRYRRIRFFLSRFLEPIDRFLMQNELYARRISELGARRESVRVVGSLKFDADSGAGGARRARFTPGGCRILIAGSTLAPEESVLLSVFERLRTRLPDLRLVLAPRHPARFGEVTELARSRGLSVARRSDPSPASSSTQVFVLDTLGELASLYAEADYVFVGGSLAPWGGHNIIEPASQAKPVLFGPHMENFADVARLFLDAGAAIQVEGEVALEEALGQLIDRPERARALGLSALRVIEENRGASDRTVSELKEILG